MAQLWGKEMKISLVRHGRPIVNLSSRIRSKEFSAWLSAYDEAGIDHSLPPPAALKRLLASCALVLTSPAKRAVESADVLDLRAERKITIDAREAPLPTRIIWPLSHRPTVFTVIARIVWLSGLVRANEDKQEVRRRARDLTLELSALSLHFGHVALIGHGYMNMLLCKNLEASGWCSSGSRANGYWSCLHFEKEQFNQSPPQP